MGGHVILVVYGIDDDRTDIQPINHGWLASSIDVFRGGELL